MKYSRSLDLVLASLREAKAGKMETAAVCFEKALKQKDLDVMIATLEGTQKKAFDELAKANPTVAAMFKEVAAKRAKAKKATKAKGKPFGGKQAPPFGKKKEKADADTDLAPVLDEMTSSDEDGEEFPMDDVEDLTLDDLEDLDEGEGDGVAEMPESGVDTAAESDDDEDSEDDEKEESAEGDDEDDEKEESSEDDGNSNEDEKDDMDDVSTVVQTAGKVKVVSANLAALDRLTKSMKSKAVKAGVKKPAK
jgi:hypothetical protein